MREKIAVIGIGCVFPDASDFTEYWRNIIERKNSIKDISGQFWNEADFYDSDPKALDKMYCKMGAIVDPIEFDSMEFGMSPKVMESTSVEQLFALITARQALIDAGFYGEGARPFNRKKTGVIVSAIIGENAFSLSHRTEIPKIERILHNNGVPDDIIKRVIKRYRESLCDWTEDCNPGYIPNVVAGRIANRFDLGGTSCCVDAACGSSLASLKFAVDELQNENCDMMIAGGVNLDSSLLSYISFCKTPAISKTGKIKPFDKDADGMICGDGVGLVVLKRLSDAQRDNDKIYAVIRSVGTSSDGRAKSIYAPSKEGQIRALNAAYDKAEISTDAVGLIEAHGTGTAAGDSCEVSAICETFNKDSNKRDIIIGSVKSQIGHLRMSAGIAGFIKTVLALHEKVLPSSINVDNINNTILNSNLCVLSKPKAWTVNKNRPLRVAGVSAFGFGGTNFHVVAEEYQSDYDKPYRITPSYMGVMISGADNQELIDKIKLLCSKTKENPREWFDSSYRYHKVLKNNICRLAFVAKNADEVITRCQSAIRFLENSSELSWVNDNIAYSRKPLNRNNKVTVLFPGQGTQKINMFSEIAMNYPEVRKSIEFADNILIDNGANPVSELVYPHCQTDDELKNAEELLQKTGNTQPALASLSSALYTVAKSRGLKADSFIGHSFGELVALWADGLMDDQTLIKISLERGRLMSQVDENMSMTAVMTDKATLDKICNGFDKVYIANQNSPKQIVISGEAAQLEKISEKLSALNIKSVKLNVASAFHSPFMNNASKEFGKYLNTQNILSGSGKVISDFNNEYYPVNDKEKVCEFLEKQLVNPVKFTTAVEKAYKEGSRVFVEIGNGKVLCNFVNDILNDKECEVIAAVPDKNKDSLSQFEFALSRLAVLGIDISDDMYRVIPDERFVLKKTKTSYTVNSDVFYLPEKEKSIRESEKIIDKSQAMLKTEAEPVNKAQVKDNVQNEKSINMGMVNNMKVSNENVQSIQTINAEVFSRFMDIQNEQIDAISRLFEKSNAKSETDKKNIIDCISVFQNNSMKAFETYFRNQTNEAITSNDMSIRANTENVPVQNSSLKTEEERNTEFVVEKVPVKKNVDIHKIVLDTISDKTGYPADMIELDMELEGDLGIDSIKRVELLSEINTALGEIFTQDDVEALASIGVIKDIEEYLDNRLNNLSISEERDNENSSVKSNNVQDVVIDVISDKTGYPKDMIELDMELEGDLGIDSIKRVEIFSDINEIVGCKLTAEDTENLSELMSINDIVDFISAKV